MSLPQIAIAGRPIGPGHPPYVIAELSANHNGDIGRALELMEIAKKAGADAVKLQTYTADTITIDHDGPGFVIDGGLWHGRRLYDLYREASTPWNWHEALFAKGRELDITVFSSPFDATAVDFLESLGAPAYKVASFELVDLPLIRRIAATGKPMILSSGMAGMAEIREAMDAATQAGCRELVVLHCISGYPTPIAEANLHTITHLRDTLGVVVGLSDHTLGTIASTTAIALGASVIEKHYTLSRADGGPDAAFSLEPDELALLCRSCHDAYQALGAVRREPTGSERANMAFRRSLYAVADIPAGGELTPDNVRSIRPGYGLAPKHLPDILGRRSRHPIPRGTPLAWDLIA